MMVVVAYDVNTETPEGRKRLRAVAKISAKYGQRVQNSVFECEVSPSDYLMLVHDLVEVMDQERDSLRMYKLGAKHSSKIEQFGRRRHLPVDDVMLI
ncbi:CRISPR-associated endonuclease Cas2 [Bifidobacterium eulemuris]|uniref:CRISPR-associated endoribonuclease Cas2 n=1 Tax=Bifidobacterium eulemuris TaxID=1765219 RepID=A0A7L9SR71_9BIFI|nr:CRISPR-associated endonuclease Cas2 [Bifidobacterium eulemuris]QOL32841.1 CRISPR-associated endonuclease Cas2 [Bifidobacterium eulemuris]